MALILNIETSTHTCSVALAKDGSLLSIREEKEQNHAAVLPVMIKQLMEEANLPLYLLDAVAINAGPGSYTGLRIGIAAAKGLCYALEKPLIALNSLHLLATEGIRECPFSSLYCPVIDARKNEIYYGLYRQDETIVQAPEAICITDQFLMSYLAEDTILMIGNGVLKHSKMVAHKNLKAEETALPSAATMCALSYKYYIIQKFSDVSAFEPYYLKPAYINLRLAPIV